MLRPQSGDTFEISFLNYSIKAVAGSKSLGQWEMVVSLEIRKIDSAGRLQYLCGTFDLCEGNTNA